MTLIEVLRDPIEILEESMKVLREHGANPLHASVAWRPYRKTDGRWRASVFCDAGSFGMVEHEDAQTPEEAAHSLLRLVRELVSEE